MEFRVLGPLEVLTDGLRLDLGGQRQQIVLASLTMEPGRVVSVGRLMTAVYGERLPGSARAQVQICVSALRRLLAAHGRPEAIATRHHGYALEIPDDEVDLQQYDELVTAARAAGKAGFKDEAITAYRQALRMWRGAALDGLDSPLLQTVADRLAERRLTANEDCIEFELDLGRHRDLIAELTGLVATHPLRERLRGQLMLALYRSGRQAEALESYRSARRALIDELGLEPSEWLQQLEHSILSSDAELTVPVETEPVGRAMQLVPGEPEAVPTITAPPPAMSTGEPAESAASVPKMLPTDIADFTGRAKQIDEVKAHLDLAADNPAQFAVPVIVLAGKPGIGKTTLCVHAAHLESWRYPDGQLFADLHGDASHRVGPMQILERFLRTLGVPGASVPDGLEERAEVYRALLSDRRVLVVLDNVASETQVLPLMPGNPHTAVMVTSRRRLGGLPGAVHVAVDVFESQQSVELLSRIAGDRRVKAEADAAADLAALCGQLPLALRIAGARLSARPHWTVEQLADRLENESRRLDELKHGALGIRVSISLTYDNLSDDARRLFRLLAVLDFPHFSGWVGAALMDVPLADAQDLLDDLVDAQLLEIDGNEAGMSAQYRFHDLIRVFARERLATEDTVGDRNAALERVLGALLFLAEEAHRRLHGSDNLQLHSAAPRWQLAGRSVNRLIGDSMAWFERERRTLVAAVGQAAKLGLVTVCWDIAMTAVTLFESRVYLNDWRDTHKIALTATRTGGDHRGQAVMLFSTGSLCIVEKKFDDARRHLEEASDLFQALGDSQGEALVSRGIGYLDRMAGNLDEAARRYKMALDVLRSSGDLAAAAYMLHSMAQIELDRGNADSAMNMLPQALELSRRVGSRRIEAQVLHRMGDAHLQAGESAEAVAAFGEALAAVHDLGDPIGEAYALHGLGMAHLRCGDYTEAGSALSSAQRLATNNGERLIEARIESSLGELALSLGKPPQAVVHLHRALGLFRGIQAPLFESKVLAKLSEAYAAAGGTDHPVIDPAEVAPLDDPPGVAASPIRDRDGDDSAERMSDRPPQRPIVQF